MKTTFLLLTILLLSACSPEELGHAVSVRSSPSFWLDTDLAGVDADKNGIRDDVDAAIEAQGFKPKAKEVAIHIAKIEQEMLTNTDMSRDNLKRLVVKNMDSYSCIFLLLNKDENIYLDKKLNDNKNSEYRYILIDMTNHATFNTRSRLLRQDKTWQAFNGEVYPSESDEVSCKKSKY